MLNKKKLTVLYASTNTYIDLIDCICIYITESILSPQPPLIYPSSTTPAMESLYPFYELAYYFI